MNHKQVVIAVTACLLMDLSGQDAEFTISSSPGQVVLGYVAETGRCYEIWATTDPGSGAWTGPIESQLGTGEAKAVPVSTASFDRRFFQLRITDLAPEGADFANQVVGGFLADTNYRMTSATRFSWFGETGDWTYQKNASGSATIVFTYDEDGNNASVYREEVVLNFTDKGTGTFSYCEFNFDSCDQGSLIEGAPFTL